MCLKVLNWSNLPNHRDPPKVDLRHRAPARWSTSRAGREASTLRKAEWVVYWPHATPSERRDLLYREWAGIVALLEREIEGVAAALTTPEPGASGLEIKAYEDTLDAVICAWVAVCALEGRAVAFGDDSGVIWIP